MPKARLLAIYALLDIFAGKEKPKQTIEKISPDIDERDRAFLMEIVYGVLRFRDTLDWILKQFLRNPSKLSGFTIHNLRIALYQIFFMRVPDWAVVHEAVDMEKSEFKPTGRLSGKPSLVNAVLRNVLRQKDRFAMPLQIEDPLSMISLNTSHPRWLVRRWIKRFGREEASLLAYANNEIPPLVIRVNTLRISRAELLKRLSREDIHAEPTRFSPDGIRLKHIRSYHALSFIKGLFTVQDEASQLISYLLGPQQGERILDACAAPGGKATHIAEIIGDRGEIVAVEIDPIRSQRLNENIANLGIKSVRVINDDIDRIVDIGTFDRVLVDAPCSSIGVIRRNPDIKYRHKAGDLQEFKEKQLALLRSAARFLKINGLLVYSVCSTETEEGDDVVKAFLKTEEEFRIIDAESEYIKNVADNNFLRTFPHKHSMDGFFGVRLCRRKC